MLLTGPPLTDFTPETTDFGWYVLNDNVMGGRSEGSFEQTTGELHFAGRTNTDGGGFSSIRSKALRLDLSGKAGIQLKVKGDGRRYTWRLSTNAQWRGRQIGYWAEFATQDAAWSTVNIPFSSFEPKYRGYALDGPPINIAEISGMGLMIYDKQDGRFELRLASIGTYDDEEIQ